MRAAGARSLAVALITILASLAGPPACEQTSVPLEAAEADDGVALQLGDLHEIRRAGELRVLSLRARQRYLPRAGSPADHERGLARALAEELGVRASFVTVEAFDELIPALLEGRGDLIADNLTATEERRALVAFSSPLAFVREQLVARADDPSPLSGPADLAGRRVSVTRASSFWSTLEEVRERVPELELEALPEALEVEAMLDAVARSELDLTVADSNLMAAVASWRDDLRVAFDLGPDRVIAWAMRPDASELRRAVDRFLARRHRGDSAAHHTDDLPGIRARKVLRVLTRNSATTYFIWRGELMGFEYDLARRFADSLGLRIELVVPPTRDDLFAWLRAGRGDIVAAGLTASPERAASEDVAFSRPYLTARQTIVTRSNDTIRGPADLAGRDVFARRSSSYWSTLHALHEGGIDLHPREAPESLETEQIIDAVARGEFDVTLADSHILDVVLAWREDVRAAGLVGDEQAHGWALRSQNPELLAAVDAFFDAEVRSTWYNLMLAKYFRNRRQVLDFRERRATHQRGISPYDELARKYARRYGFDWRLVVAQMHQESRFDPDARSFAGARGLLQVMPRTAHEFGFSELADPEIGIHAGVRYLSWTRDRFERELEVDDRLWFSLAAYNAGSGHVRDARRLARAQGLDPNRWFDNVEHAMLLKEQPEFHRTTRFGYCRCSEPVRYVRAIRERYQAYVGLAPPDAPAPPAPPAAAAE